jgi:hypothetical protein
MFHRYVEMRTIKTLAAEKGRSAHKGDSMAWV